MTTAIQTKDKTPIEQLKHVMSMPSVQDQFRNALADKKDIFTASIIDLYAGDTYLQKCEPKLVVMEALKAATLNLPINRSLGFAWIVPRYNGRQKAFIPAFQPGWRGIVQLAQRTGQYKYINCGIVCDGEIVTQDRLSGAVFISGDPTTDNAIGYFAYIELLTGFSKASFWTKEKVEAHVLKYNQESKKAGSIVGNWKEHFDERAQTTVLKHLIQKFGPMSVDLANVISAPDGDSYDPDEDYQENANAHVIDIDQDIPDNVNTETGEMTGQQQQAAQGATQEPATDQPDF